MKEIDRLKARVINLNLKNSPTFIATIMPTRTRNSYKVSYSIRRNKKCLDAADITFSTREEANDYCSKIVSDNNIPDDKAIILNIVSTREGYNDRN